MKGSRARRGGPRFPDRIVGRRAGNQKISKYQVGVRVPEAVLLWIQDLSEVSAPGRW
jgi:hypothetical protein